MGYSFNRTAKNTAEAKTESGGTIKLVFAEKDSPQIENLVVNNLLTSYEKRIKRSLPDLNER